MRDMLLGSILSGLGIAYKIELGMAGDLAYQIYQSRQTEPDENQLICTH